MSDFKERVAKRRAGWVERHERQIETLLTIHFEPGERVAIVHGVPAAERAETGPHTALTPLLLIPIVLILFVNGAVGAIAFVGVIVFGFSPRFRRRDYLVAVTDRRLLLLPLSMWKGLPSGPTISLALTQVEVGRFRKPSFFRNGWTLHLLITDPAGSRTMRLIFLRVKWLPTYAIAIRKALERGNPVVPGSQIQGGS